MTLVWPTDPVTAFAISVVLLVVTYLLQPRVRIVWTVSHAFAHLLLAKDFAAKQTPEQAKNDPPPQNIAMWAQTVIVMNRGRATAENVEVVLNHKSLGLTIWPHRQYFESRTPDNKLVLTFSSLAPRESITIQMIDTNELPPVASVRSKTKAGKYVSTQPQIQYSNWLLGLVWATMIIGALYVFWIVVLGIISALRYFQYI